MVLSAEKQPGYASSKGLDSAEVGEAVTALVQKALHDVLDGVDGRAAEEVGRMFKDLVQSGDKVADAVGIERKGVLRRLIDALSGRESPKKDVDVLKSVTAKLDALKKQDDKLKDDLNELRTRNEELERLLEVVKKAEDAKRSLASDPGNPGLKQKAAVASGMVDKTVSDVTGGKGGPSGKFTNNPGLHVVSDDEEGDVDDEQVDVESLKLRLGLLQEDVERLNGQLAEREKVLSGLQEELVVSGIANGELHKEVNAAQIKHQEINVLLRQAQDRAALAESAGADVMHLRETLLEQVSKLAKDLTDVINVVGGGSSELVCPGFTFKPIEDVFAECGDLFLRLQPNIIARRLDYYGNVQRLFEEVSVEINTKIPTRELMLKVSRLLGMIMTLFDIQEQMIREHVNAEAEANDEGGPESSDDGTVEVPNEWVTGDAEGTTALIDFYELLGCKFGDDTTVIDESYGKIKDKDKNVEYAYSLLSDSDKRTQYDSVYFQFVFSEKVKEFIGACCGEDGSVKDYYDVLEVSRDADKDSIKKAYRKLSKRYHPDHNPDDQEAEEKFKEIAEVYQTLFDEEKRAIYDQYLNYLNK